MTAFRTLALNSHLYFEGYSLCIPDPNTQVNGNIKETVGMSWLLPSVVKTVVNTGVNGEKFSDIFIAITDYGHIPA